MKRMRSRKSLELELARVQAGLKLGNDRAVEVRLAQAVEATLIWVLWPHGRAIRTPTTEAALLAEYLRSDMKRP